MTTEPSALSAAKASREEKIWLTPDLSWLATALLSPPSPEYPPQVTTEPSALSAAKAKRVEKIWLTPKRSWLATSPTS